MASKRDINFISSTVQESINKVLKNSGFFNNLIKNQLIELRNNQDDLPEVMDQIKLIGK